MVMGDIIATHKGIVVTSTTELATEVYSSDVIQKAKWNARNIPANTKNIKTFPLTYKISFLCENKINGIKINVARPNR
jgi:hypothetical protein